MYTTNYSTIYSSYLSHSGKKGMKWGIRNKKKQLNKFENKKVNNDDKTRAKLKKQQDKLLDLYKKRKKANGDAANAVIAAIATYSIGSLMSKSNNYYVAKLGYEFARYAAPVSLLVAGAHMLYSSDLKQEQNSMQARYGFRLDESKLK